MTEIPVEPRVLFVDDDPNILDSFRRSYRKHLNLETAEGGRQALALLREAGPFAVIICDQRMPEMSGVQVLREVARGFPDTVRIMLTGNADQQTAIDAVNKGQVQRFLVKPTPPAALLAAIQDGMRLWEARRLERELLEGTLTGSIRMLTEILGQLHPDSFARSERLLRIARHLVRHHGLQSGWRFELAAMLGQLGCIALDATILVRLDSGFELSADEKLLFAAHPALGSRLLRQLPRMEPVARMIELQFEPLDDHQLSCPLTELDAELLGGHLLQIAVLLDRAVIRGRPFKAAVHDLLARGAEFRRDLLEPLLSLELSPAGSEARPLQLRELREGMELAGDVRARNEALLARAGQVLSVTMLERFHAFAASVGLIEPLMVRSARREDGGGLPLPMIKV
jgi:response regulator RpfG family c-di-GMP phosphodiesterase